MGTQCSSPEQQLQIDNHQIKHENMQNSNKNSKQNQNKKSKIYEMLCCLQFCRRQDEDEEIVDNPEQAEERNENTNKIKIKPIQFTEKSQKSDNFSKINNFCCARNQNDDIWNQINSAHRVNIKNQQKINQKQDKYEQNLQPNKKQLYFSFHPTQINQNQQNLKNIHQQHNQQTQQITQQQNKVKRQSNQKNPQIIVRAKNASVISQYYNGGAIRLNKIQIPFQVIKLSLHSNILKALNIYYPQFLQKYSNKSDARSSQWRMLKNGTYTNLLQNLHGIFITKDQFYEGFYIKNSQISYSPDQNGIFIDKQHVYQGEFKEGKPNGKGKLIFRDNEQIYDGNWFQGNLIEGIIQKQDFIYSGQLYQNVPSGIGQLKIKKKNITYKGKFLEGNFDDQDAEYDCKQYSYKGGFKNGHKHGFGILFDKINQIQRKGNWILDKILITQRASTSQRTSFKSNI